MGTGSDTNPLAIPQPATSRWLSPFFTTSEPLKIDSTLT